jgi:effector-binding domain-containing protein
MEIEVMERTSADAVVERITTPLAELGERMGAAYERLGERLAALGATPTGPPVAIYVNTDDESAWTIAVGFPLAPPLPVADDLEVLHLPGGLSVVARHQGAYEGLAGVWQEVTEYLSQEGLEATAPPWESYVAAPPAVARPEEWLTEVVMPVAGRS